VTRATAVVGVQALREFVDQLGRDSHRAGVAVASGDALDRAVFGEQTVDKVGTGLDRSPNWGSAASRGARCWFAMAWMSSIVKRDPSNTTFPACNGPSGALKLPTT